MSANQQQSNPPTGATEHSLAPSAGSASPATDSAWDVYNRKACGLHYIAHKMRAMEIALRTAQECIESNRRHIESMGRHATAGTSDALDEIANALRTPNEKGEPR
jgi:hypothetical protein